jgi:hypothetical protein
MIELGVFLGLMPTYSIENHPISLFFFSRVVDVVEMT